jgi:hypothetical protein
MKSLYNIIISNSTSEVYNSIAKATTVDLCDRVDIALCANFENSFMPILRFNRLKFLNEIEGK